MSVDIWPKVLEPVQGPMRALKIAGAAAGMGQWGPQLQGLGC